MCERCIYISAEAEEARRSYFECLYRVEEEGNGCNIRERVIKLFL